jgi:hypothetical protein
VNHIERRTKRTAYVEMIESIASLMVFLEDETPQGPERDRTKAATWHLLTAADRLREPAPVTAIPGASLERQLEQSLRLVQDVKRMKANQRGDDLPDLVL